MTSIFPPGLVRLSARPEFETDVRRAVDGVVEALVAASPRPLAAVFLAGSAASGEAVAFECAPRDVVCLSDLDLGLVLRAPGDRSPVRAAVTAWLESDAASRARAFFSGIDVGLYAASDLAAQPLKPGTFEMASSAVVLRGDRAALDALRRFEPDAIPPVEGRRLLANRVAELIRATYGRPSRERLPARAFDARYAAGKLLLDAGVSVLAASGGYCAGMPARMAALETSTAVRDAFGERTDAYLEEARFWSDLRSGRRTWNEVAGRYGAEGVVPAALWERSREAVAGVWRWFDGARRAGLPPRAGRDSARRWRAWARGRPARERLEALARVARAAPHEAADEAVVRLFAAWPAGGAAPPDAALERRLKDLLPSPSRPEEGAGFEAWARALLAARADMIRAGDE